VLSPEGTSPGPGRTSMDRAMRALFGVEEASLGIRFAGGTDRSIARTLLGKAGLRPDEVEANVPRFLEAYVSCLDEELARRRYRPIGDVAFAVTTLRARGACIGIGTGNVRAGARLKLRSAGLDALFDLERGGFGCDADHRPELLRVAVERCAPHVPRGAPVVVVGDTRHDVTAARAIGARVIGVAASLACREELLEAGADRIVDDCGGAVVEALDALG
jgi:phosphoglycolate phosphatase